MAVIVVAVLAAAPPAALASPAAVDQYTTHFAGAGGNSALKSGSAPVARPWLLSKRTRAKLSGPDAQLLVQIATAPALGAPTPPKHGVDTSGGAPGLATAIAGAVGTGPGLALTVAIVAVGGAIAGSTIVRRRSGL